MSNINGTSVVRGAAGSGGPTSKSRDLSSDFVFDMRVLGRQAGTFRDETRTARAPEGVGSGLVLVPADADVTLDLRFEAVSEGVLVTGSAGGPPTGGGARGLDPGSSAMEGRFPELYLYPPGPAEGEGGDEERLLARDPPDPEP